MKRLVITSVRKSSRQVPCALNGWDYLMLPEQWTQLAEQLRQALPPYIFVSTYYGKEDFMEILRRRAPSLLYCLTENYQELHRSKTGIWYVRQKPPPAHP